MLFPLTMSRAQQIRILADASIINLSTIIALFVQFNLILLSSSWQSTGIVPAELLDRYASNYLNTFWLLTAVCLAIFALSGFYTHSRTYQSRYKILVIVQAVSLSFLVYGFLSYFLFGGLSIPRLSLVLAWLSCTILAIAARMSVNYWAKYPHRESETPRPKTKSIKRVLVIGGAGYIGSALLPKLLARGYQVRLLDLLLYGTEPIQDLLDHPNLEIVPADFRQVEHVVESMRNVDAVIHLGAIVGDPACAIDEDLTVDVNLTATKMIAEVAKGSGVSRFVFASTCSVYGASDEILDEHSLLRPVSLYARSKIASEKVLRELSDKDFAPTILRFGTIYGLSGRTRFDLVINLLTAKAIVDGQITVFGGDQWRPFVHVDDAALAIFKAFEADTALVGNEVFNVGSDEQNYTIRQIGEMIHGKIPGAQLLNMGGDSDPRNYRVNFGKIHNVLGFVPQRTVAEGIDQVAMAIRSGEVLDYQDCMYSNAKFLITEGKLFLESTQNDWASRLLENVDQEMDRKAPIDDDPIPLGAGWQTKQLTPQNI